MHNFLSFLCIIFAVGTSLSLATIFVAIETKAKSMKTKLDRRPMGQIGHVRNYGTKVLQFPSVRKNSAETYLIIWNVKSIS